MKQLIIDVQEQKYDALKAYLEELDYVEISDEGDVVTEEELLETLRRGMKEVKLMIAGKIKKKPIEELLNELRN